MKSEDMKVLDVMEAYAASGLSGDLAFLEPDGIPSVELPDGTVFAAEGDEPPAKILDRIQRSQKAGRNLFLEEWSRFEYEPGCLY